MTYISTRQSIANSQNGYSALTWEVLERINVDIPTNSWGIHNDIISQCLIAGIPTTTVLKEPKCINAKGKRIYSKT